MNNRCFHEGWQDRALLYLHSLKDIPRRKTKLIFVRLCEYALSNDKWEDGKLTLHLSVDEMAEVCSSTRSSVITALSTLSECGAITRVSSESPFVRAVTIINFVDDM